MMTDPDSPVAGWQNIDDSQKSGQGITPSPVSGFKPLDGSQQSGSEITGSPVSGWRNIDNPQATPQTSAPTASDIPAVDWHLDEPKPTIPEDPDLVEAPFLTEDPSLYEDEGESTDSVETRESMESIENAVATAIVNANREFVAYNILLSRHSDELSLKGFWSGTHAEVDVRAVDFIHNRYPREFEAEVMALAEKNESYYGPNDQGIRLIREEDDRIVTLRSWSHNPQDSRAFPLVRRALELTQIDAASLAISYDMPELPKVQPGGFSSPTEVLRTYTRSEVEIWLGKTPAGTSIRVDVDRYGKGKTATHLVRAITFVRESMHRKDGQAANSQQGIASTDPKSWEGI